MIKKITPQQIAINFYLFGLVLGYQFIINGKNKKTKPIIKFLSSRKFNKLVVFCSW